MNNLVSINPKEFVFQSNNQLVTTSLKIADAFNKLHKDILKKIEKLECSKEFHKRNFAPMSQTIDIGNGATRKSPFYEVTKDGFMFLVMGFTGKKAAVIKEAYINALIFLLDNIHKIVNKHCCHFPCQFAFCQCFCDILI